MAKIEPKFSEALQGASVRNCYLESGYGGKGQTRLRGRMGLAKSEINAEWDRSLAAFKSGKTGNVYIATASGDQMHLRVFRDGALGIAKAFDKPWRPGTRASFAEMRFLQSAYAEGYFDGNYAILLCIAGELWALDDMDPFSAGKIKRIGVPGDGGMEMQIGSVCAAANRIVVSGLGSQKWRYSSPGATDADGIPVFGELDYEEAEYLGDSVAAVARAGGTRLAILGERSIEMWDATGDAEDPFSTSYSNQVYKIGCLPETVTEISDIVYFCGAEDLSGRKAVYSIGREGLKKLSESPLDAEITENAKGGASGGKYSEGAANFYLLHLGEYSLAYNIAENSFSKFCHRKSASETIPFDCLLSSGGYAFGSRRILRAKDGGAEWTGYFAEKMLACPVFDSGGEGHFRVKKLTVDMQTIQTPETAPQENSSIAVDYSPDGSGAFIGRRTIPIPKTGNGKAYPLRIWGLGRCSNLKLRIYTALGNFILNGFFLDTEETL